MKKRIKTAIFQALSQEAGQALILVLIFLLLGSLTLVPALQHMSTTLKTSTDYENKTAELFTADSGVEDSMWRIKYDFMGPDYDPYDFDTICTYETPTINDRTADTTIQNVWLPSNVSLDDFPSLSIDEVRTMLESEKLAITGTSGAVPGLPYHIKIDFTPASGDNLTVTSIGIWLPQGFTYTGDCTLTNNVSAPYYPDDVDVTVVDGGTTVVWSYNYSPTAPHYPLFADFPGVDPEVSPMETEIEFDYSPPADHPTQMPLAMPWITTQMTDSDGNPKGDWNTNPDNVPLSWDIDTRFFKITSTTGNTAIEAYSSKSNMRSLGDAIAGDYEAVGNSLMITPDYTGARTVLLSDSSTTESAIPEDGDAVYAYLYWSGSQYCDELFEDLCEDWSYFDRTTQTRVPISDNDTDAIGNWTVNPASPTTRWDKVDETSANETDYITGTPDSGSHYLLFGFSPFSVPAGCEITDLTVYVRARDASSGTNNIRPSIKVNGTSYNTTATSNSPGGSFTTYSYSYTTNPATTNAWTVDEINGVPSATELQQFGVYSTDLNPDVQVCMVYAEVNYSRWYLYNSDEFRCRGSTNATTEQRTITLKNSFNLSSYPSGQVAISWDQDESGTLESDDTLYFALYSDEAGWSNNIVAFSNDDPDDNPAAIQHYVIPDAYKTSSFKMRFYCDFDATDEYAILDEVHIVYMPPDESITFEIDGQQVYLDANGDPQAGAQPLTASHTAVMYNEVGWTRYNDYDTGYSYACYRDVTKLVKTYPINPGEEHHTGNYAYTIGSVDADTHQQVSYAGWSLIIIYGSPETVGQYIYLRDIRDLFAFNRGAPGISLDFDQDGDQGGDVTGFIFPEPIRDKYGVITEDIAAKLTCFVGEGDSSIANQEYVRITGQQSALYEDLSNSASPANNPWNSASPGMSYQGVDVDTFELPWEDGILTPGDTYFTLDLHSNQDAFNLVYVIISVRTEIATSPTKYFSISGL